jgi:hypothetical protein
MYHWQIAWNERIRVHGSEHNPTRGPESGRRQHQWKASTRAKGQNDGSGPPSGILKAVQRRSVLMPKGVSLSNREGDYWQQPEGKTKMARRRPQYLAGSIRHQGSTDVIRSPVESARGSVRLKYGPPRDTSILLHSHHRKDCYIESLLRSHRRWDTVPRHAHRCALFPYCTLRSTNLAGGSSSSATVLLQHHHFALNNNELAANSPLVGVTHAHAANSPSLGVI